MNTLGNIASLVFAALILAFAAAWFTALPTIGLLWCIGVLK